MSWLAQGPPDRETALVDGSTGRRLSYGELRAEVVRLADALRAQGPRTLVFLGATHRLESVLLYLAALEAAYPLLLCEPQAESLARLCGVYGPGQLLLPAETAAPSGYAPGSDDIGRDHRLWRSSRPFAGDLHPDLVLLLTTSGSTGSPKLVRLSQTNLESNARSIAQYLGLDARERAIQSLPMHYSYGLSVLNSHLAAGARVVLTAHSFLRPEFWREFSDQECTSFAGVPYVYETLHRLRFDPAAHPTLRTITQAGGGLRPDLIHHFRLLAERAAVRFFVMYGQTEATARISYVPPESLADHEGAIGIPIPGGRISLEAVEGSANLRELVYRGPGVMLGYAEGPKDLALGDRMGGVLRTGDLAVVDDQGYYTLTGRLGRFAKLFGHRISLEDVEQDIEAAFPVKVIARERGGELVLVLEGSASVEAVRERVSKKLGIPPLSIEITAAEALPRTTSGKKDYKAAL